MNKKRMLEFVTAAVGLSLFSMCATATHTNAVPERVGTDDSRILAYTHFWSEAHQRKLRELTRAVKEAKSAGQTGGFKELDAALWKQRERSHLQLFSTAPVDDILAEMQDRVEVAAEREVAHPETST